MSTRTYNHSPYWYAKKHTLYAHKKRPHKRKWSDASDVYGIEFQKRKAKRELSFLNSGPYWSRFDNSIYYLTYCIIIEIGKIMADAIIELPEGNERNRVIKTLKKYLQHLRRSDYYEADKRRREALALERRKIKKRTTSAEMPAKEQIMEAWNRRKESKERMIILGGLLQDLECYVDNRLKIDAKGRIVGRRGGIKAWLFDNLPELYDHYKTLMRYKAMVIKLRQATETKDPTPTGELLTAKIRHKIVAEILHIEKNTFSAIIFVLNNYLLRDRVYK